MHYAINGENKQFIINSDLVYTNAI